MNTILRLAALAMLCAPLHVAAECPAAEQAVLEKMDRDWGNAAQAGDGSKLEAALADDFRDLAPGSGGGKAESIAEALKTAAEAKGQPNPVESSSDHYNIHCTRTSATITHRTVFSGKDASGKPWSSQRRAVHTLEKRDGRWQVVATIATRLGDGDMLRYLELDWAAADLSGPAAWIEHNYADDFSGVSSRTGKFSSKAEDLADARAAKIKTNSAQLRDMNVRVSGDAAVVTGEYHSTGTDAKGAAFDRRIAFTDTWKKVDGRWLVWASQGTLITE